MNTYTCPTCGHRIAPANAATLTMHQVVSHSGKPPIVAQD